MVSHPDLSAEQAYVDHAHVCLERMREVVGRAATATDQEVAALALEAWNARRLATYEDAERGLLTPMQLRMVARRARAGSLTALGDVAQATGAVV